MIREERHEYIRSMVDGWPAVSPETYARLALLLAPARAATAERPRQSGDVVSRGRTGE
ncbi:hypothetical protein [Streptomyces phaeochromogenes]